MADFVFGRRFLEDLARFQKSASARDLEHLENTLAMIAQDPNLPGRMQSYYDPAMPSYLYRSGQLLVHYRLIDYDQVEFLNLFWPRV